MQKAEIGYRIAERHGGNGYATAVGRVVRAAFGVYGLHRLEAATLPRNVGSPIVLLRNGFAFWGRARSSHLLNGVWEGTVMLERHAGG